MWVAPVVAPSFAFVVLFYCEGRSEIRPPKGAARARRALPKHTAERERARHASRGYVVTGYGVRRAYVPCGTYRIYGTCVE